MLTDLAALVAGAHPQLVDLRFGRVGPLLRVVELVLELPVLGQVAVGLLLLQTRRLFEDVLSFFGSRGC